MKSIRRRKKFTFKWVSPFAPQFRKNIWDWAIWITSYQKGKGLFVILFGFVFHIYETFEIIKGSNNG